MKELTETAQGHFISHWHSWDLNLEVTFSTLPRSWEEEYPGGRRRWRICIWTSHSLDHIFSSFQVPAHHSSPLPSAVFFFPSLSPLLPQLKRAPTHSRLSWADEDCASPAATRRLQPVRRQDLNDVVTARRSRASSQGRFGSGAARKWQDPDRGRAVSGLGTSGNMSGYTPDEKLRLQQLQQLRRRWLKDQELSSREPVLPPQRVWPMERFWNKFLQDQTPWKNVVSDGPPSPWCTHPVAPPAWMLDAC